MYLQSKISRLFFYFHQIHSNSSSVIESFGFFFHLGSLHLFSSHSVFCTALSQSVRRLSLSESDSLTRTRSENEEGRRGGEISYQIV